MFIHGDRDEMVPISHGYELFEKASFPKTFVGVENCGHVEALAREPIRDTIVQFLESNSLELQYIRKPLELDVEYQKPPSDTKTELPGQEIDNLEVPKEEQQKAIEE